MTFINNFVIFEETLKIVMREILRLQFSGFNEAVGGALVLTSANNDGNFKQMSFLRAMTDGMIIDRDPTQDVAIPSQTITMDTKNSVKSGMGTKLIEWDRTSWNWINRDPREAAAHFAENFAEQRFRRYFDHAVAILYAAMRNDDALLRFDGTAEPTPSLTLDKFPKAVRKFGDAAGSLNVWLTHSQPLYDLDIQNIQNSQELFEYSNVIVRRDPYGRIIIQSDSPSFIEAGTPDVYHMFCLRPGALFIEENDDFEEASLPVLGNTNIKQAYQAEWSANYEVSGYRWDEASGGTSPDFAALSTTANWEKWQTNNPKLLPGVLLEVNLA